MEREPARIVAEGLDDDFYTEVFGDAWEGSRTRTTAKELHQQLMAQLLAIGVAELDALAAPLFADGAAAVVRTTMAIMRQETWTQSFLSLRYVGVAAADATLFQTKVHALEGTARVNAVIGRYRIAVAHILAAALLRAAGSRTADRPSGPELARHIVLVLAPASRLVAEAIKEAGADGLLNKTMAETMKRDADALSRLLQNRTADVKAWVAKEPDNSKEYTKRMAIQLGPTVPKYALERDVISTMVDDAVATALVELGAKKVVQPAPPVKRGGLDTDLLAAINQQMAHWSLENLKEAAATVAWAPLPGPLRSIKDLHAAFDKSMPAARGGDSDETDE